MVILSSLQHDRYFIMIVQWSFLHLSSTIYYKLTTTVVPMVVSVHMPYWGLFSLRNQSWNKDDCQLSKRGNKIRRWLLALWNKFQVPNCLVQSAGFSLKTQPRLFLLPTSFHGLTTATVSSWVHLILSSNLYRKFRTLRQDLFSWHPVTTTQHLSWKKLHWLPISECVQYDIIQLYCLCVETFAFWLVIYIKTFNKINNKTSNYIKSFIKLTIKHQQFA